MLPDIFQMLKASAAVKNIVGVNPPRIYRHGSAPQRDPKAPPVAYCTWFLVSGIPQNNLSDPPDLDRMTVQIDCWHPEDSGVDLLASAVRDAMESICHMTNVILDQQEPETKLYRMSMEFDVFHGRS